MGATLVTPSKTNRPARRAKSENAFFVSLSLVAGILSADRSTGNGATFSKAASIFVLSWMRKSIGKVLASTPSHAGSGPAVDSSLACRPIWAVGAVATLESDKFESEKGSSIAKGGREPNLIVTAVVKVFSPPPFKATSPSVVPSGVPEEAG